MMTARLPAMQGPNADVPHEQGEGDAMARPMEEARGKRPKGVPHNATQGRGSSRGRLHGPCGAGGGHDPLGDARAKCGCAA